MNETQKPKILLVEDDLGLASIYSARFQIEGFNVLHCNDGDSALQKGREFIPDLILLDLMMPMQSGFDTLDLFRHTPGTERAKIIIMSALSQHDDIERTKQLGADDYFVKSQITIDEVIVRIKKHLGISDAADKPAA